MHDEGVHVFDGLHPGAGAQAEIEPSAEFQQDAAFLQSASFDLEPDPNTSGEEMPPPLPVGPMKCDW